MQSDRWRFGAVALFRPRKGLEILLDAFEQLCFNDDRPNRFSLDIIGSFETPSYEAFIRRQIDGLDCKDKIKLHGFVTDAPVRMRELDYLVLLAPSARACRW